MHGEKDRSSTVVDVTGSKFKASGGYIHFLNGVVEATADSFYGGDGLDGRLHDGKIVFGVFNGGETPAVLRLVGDPKTKFNTAPWIDEHGDVITPKHFIDFDLVGVLEAPSAQIFNAGLGDGTVTDSQGIRQDAEDAISFWDGTLLINDGKYNIDYLDSASYFPGAQVEVKADTSGSVPKAALTYNLQDNPEGHNFYAGVKAGVADLDTDEYGNGYNGTGYEGVIAQTLDLEKKADGTANTIEDSYLSLGSSTDGQPILTVGGETPTLPVQISVDHLELRGIGKATINADIKLKGSSSSDGSELRAQREDHRQS